MLPAASAIILALFISCGRTGVLQPSALTCEYMEKPVIDIPSPRFSWIDEVTDVNAGNEVQTAYRIVVSSRKGLAGKGKGDVWDSGIVQSDESHLVAYGGLLVGGEGLGPGRKRIPLERGRQFLHRYNGPVRLEGLMDRCPVDGRAAR